MILIFRMRGFDLEEKYWTMMTQKKFDLIYLGHHLHRNILIERYINVFLAITSVGALSGLVILNDYKKIISIILALSQIITAAKPYLPYSNRVKDLDKSIIGLTTVYNEIEDYWDRIVIEKICESDINKMYRKLQNKWNDIDNKFLNGDSLPRIQKYIELSEKERNIYFKNYYGEK
ncbi:hypothetical protein SAMN02745111_02003 [Eubacterium uniforme]|uniref:SMODS and SLOG-associating 2TM effector domain-containing protein n=1 Tax=Eubacterium uniforme TaxID=39495 RepID=A0A1T4VZR0_9FIRM|nr:hypothetical protein [Eubacterium uniforme]SKA70315.1 hypothetical protein SAMN02745111_02003 [Eubacterium uniforme]